MSGISDAKRVMWADQDGRHRVSGPRGSFGSVRRCIAPICMLALLTTNTVSAYRIGESVDTDVHIGGQFLNALRGQMPKFGINSRATFERPSLDADDQTFQLVFEDGLWGLPSVALVKSNGEKLVGYAVEIMYSRSGVGRLHSMTLHKLHYLPLSEHAAAPAHVEVHYHWIPEPGVQLRAGYFVMLLLSLMASIFVLTQTCLLDDSTPTSSRNVGHGSNNSRYIHKKW